MSITTARYGYRDRQTSLKSPKTGLCKRSRQLSGERALTSANTNVPPAGNMPGGTKAVTSPAQNGDTTLRSPRGPITVLVGHEGTTTRRVT